MLIYPPEDMFERCCTLNVPLCSQQVLDVVVKEVLPDVLVPGHPLHVIHLDPVEHEAVLLRLLRLGLLPPSRGAHVLSVSQVQVGGDGVVHMLHLTIDIHINIITVGHHLDIAHLCLQPPHLHLSLPHQLLQGVHFVYKTT